MSNGRGYFVSDLEQLRALGTGAMYAAVVVLRFTSIIRRRTCLYRASGAVVDGGAGAAAVAEPGVDAGERGEMHDDPVVFAITDKRSLLLGC